jgi:HupE / UreJ protein
VIAGIDTNGDGMFSESEERAYAQRVLGDLSISMDGTNVRPVLASWRFPEPAQMRDGLGEIQIGYTISQRASVQYGGTNRSLIVANHHLNRTSVYLMNALVPQDGGMQIVTQKRNEQQSLYQLDFRQLDGTGTAWSNILAWLGGIQFSSLFRLGIRHIAEGTDHLMFLLVLLLPAPLVASQLRWGSPLGAPSSLLSVLSIVTAFTVGHSITLSLAAFNAISIPSRSVEVLIAVSILMSAVHAARPIFPGKEAWIAAFFGLVHGMAFAATLDRLALERWERFAGILAFNLGIETMQMLVVIAILPSLMLMSSTRVYPILRIGGAVFAGVAAIGWLLERVFDVATPVNTIVNALAQHSLLIAVNFLVVSLACRLLARRFSHSLLHVWARDHRRRCR